jgi:hypothetical protein
MKLTTSFDNAYERISNTINSDKFKQRHRQSDYDFTRNSGLNFPTLMLFLLNLRKHSSQTIVASEIKTVS